MESEHQEGAVAAGRSSSLLCRICVNTHRSNGGDTDTNDASQPSDSGLISIFGEDALWQKISTLANVKIRKNDQLPQQVCVGCAKLAISACQFKERCEEADIFYRQHLRRQKHSGSGSGSGAAGEAGGDQAKSSGCSSGSGSGSSSASNSGSGSSSSSSSSSSDEEEDAEQEQNKDAKESRLQNGHGQVLVNGHRNGKAEEDDNDDDDGEDQELRANEAQNQQNGNLGEQHRRRRYQQQQQQQLQHHQLQQQQQQHSGMVDEEEDEDVNEAQPLSLPMANDDDGEIPVHGVHGPKEPFDFTSIRMMQEYMQHQMNKFPNGTASGPAGGVQDHLELELEDPDDDDDEDMSLPLIPEIELITPGDEPPPDVTDPTALLNGAGVGGVGVGVAVGGVIPVGPGGVMGGVMGGTGFQCPHCYQMFEMKQILKAHMQTVHGAPGPVYECTNCRKTYFYKRFLEKHIRRGRCVKKRRNQTRPMQCSDCHVLFPTGHHLGWHKRTGCPSKAAKMPLQQLFKQNIVQFNNFPKRIAAGPAAARKPAVPDTLVQNRKMGLANKRKGRTRIKLDAKKIALAKQLILREATTTVIANELNISRTFAWRLRKSLVNGVSLHERVVDPSQEDPQQQQQQQQLQQLHQQAQQLQQAEPTTHMGLPYGHLGLGLIKEEQQDSDDEEQQQQLRQHSHLQQQQQQHHHHLGLVDECGADEIGAEETAGYMGDEDAVSGLLHNGYDADPDSDPIEQDPFEGTENEVRTGSVSPGAPPLPMASVQVPVPVQVHSRNDVEVYKRLLAESQHFPHIVNAQQLQMQQQQQQREREREREREQLQMQKQQQKAHNGGMPLLTRFPQGVMNALPVNLSLRSMPHMTSNESNGSSSSNAAASAGAPATAPTGKKPRKPNVFIDDEKYAMAKLLVAQNSSTMEIARALNVSQMTAWKVRDAILKGVPLSYRNKRSEGRHSDEMSAKEQQQQHEQHHRQQQQQQQQQQQEMQQRQQQLERMEMMKQQRQQEMLMQQQQQHTSHYQQHQQQQQQQQQQQKMVLPRRRLKAAERELRDKEITREILELIREDSNIQYWKVSARLAEKGINISPSSVCQKLKSMGIHRRWKPGDKPPMLAISQLKAATAAAAAAAASLAGSGGAGGGGGGGGGNGGGGGVVPGSGFGLSDDAYEQQQFDMGGPHFLSAFTH